MPWFERSTSLSRAAIARLFLVSWLIASCLCFFRNPEAWFYPLLYAEDGTSYVGPMLTTGFWHTLMTARPDYFVFGNVLLAGAAVGVNHLLHGADVTRIPHYLAIAASLFFGLVATLPIALFAQRMHWLYLVLLAFASCFMPLNGTEYEVFGRALNIGYAFAYLAFLLVAYRNFAVASLGKRVILIDACIYLCLSTNPVAFAIAPAIYLPYLIHLWQTRSGRSLLRQPGFMSAVGLGLILLIQGSFTTIKILSLKPGNLSGETSGFAVYKLIEMFFARSLLYPVIAPIYRHLNDGLVILLAIAVIVAIVKVAQRQQRDLYGLATYSLIVFSIAAMLFRPGLFHYIQRYQTTFPDRYYYGQNLLAMFLFTVALQDGLRRRSPQFEQRVLAGMALFIVIFGGSAAIKFADHNPLRECPTLTQSLQTTWAGVTPTAIAPATPLVVMTCPAGWGMTLPAATVQTSIQSAP